MSRKPSFQQLKLDLRLARSTVESGTPIENEQQACMRW
jgi:hypothetical protein